jgi:putative flippase GtrA
MNQIVLRGAAINGIINGIINGGIQWFSFRNLEQVPISVDAITNDEVTVLGTGVHLAITLAMILTFVAYFSIKKDRRPSWGKLIWLILKHGFFTFGVVTGLSVLWQYYAGTVEVSPLAATLIVGLIAGAVAAVVNYLTLEPYATEPSPEFATR